MSETLANSPSLPSSPQYPDLEDDFVHIIDPSKPLPPWPLPDSTPTPASASASAEPPPPAPAHNLTIADPKREITAPKEFVAASLPLGACKVVIPRSPDGSDRGQILGQSAVQWSPTPPPKADLAPRFPNSTTRTAIPVKIVAYGPNSGGEVPTVPAVSSRLAVPNARECTVFGVAAKFYSMLPVRKTFSQYLAFRGKAGTSQTFPSPAKADFAIVGAPGNGASMHSSASDVGGNGMPGRHGGHGKLVDVYLSHIGEQVNYSNISVTTRKRGTQILEVGTGQSDSFIHVDASGGVGGDGGAGHRGGLSGNGGHGGHGGFIRFISSDPTLLSFVHGSTLGGFGGRGGRTNGSGGMGGSVEFLLLDPTSGAPKERSARIYDLSIVSLRIFKAIDDSIVQFEEPLVLGDVTVQNSGGMSLPAGALFRLLSTSTIEWEDQLVPIPALTPGELYTLPSQFQGKIRNPHPMPQKKAAKSDALFQVSTSLMSRTFENSAFSAKVAVRYPLKLQGVDLPASVTVAVKNISSAIYGNSEAMGAFLRFYLDARATPMEEAMQTTEDGRFFFFDTALADFNPGELRAVTYSFKSNPKGIKEFDQFHWRCELFLRGRCIQFDLGTMDVITGWVQGAVGRSVLITGRFMTREVYKGWKKLLKLLNLSPFKIWDVEYYGGYEGYNKTTGQLLTLNDGTVNENRTWIVPFPHNGPYQLGLPINQILLHFRSFSSVTNPTDRATIAPDPAGAAIFGASPVEVFRAFMAASPLVNMSETFVEKFFINDPTPEKASNRAYAIISDTNALNSSLSVVNHIVFGPEKISLATYRFGQLWTRRTEFCRSVGLHASAGYIHEFPVVKPGVNFWTKDTIGVICTVIHSMPINGRLNLLRSPHLKALRLDATVDIQSVKSRLKAFFTGNKDKANFGLTLLDFVCLSLFKSFRTDFQIETKQRTFPHLRGLVWACQQEPDAYAQCHELLTAISFALKQTQSFVSIGDAGIVRDIRKQCKQAIFRGNRKLEEQVYEPASKAASAMVDLHGDMVKLGFFIDEASTHILSGLYLWPSPTI